MLCCIACHGVMGLRPGFELSKKAGGGGSTRNLVAEAEARSVSQLLGLSGLAQSLHQRHGLLFVLHYIKVDLLLIIRQRRL